MAGVFKEFDEPSPSITGFCKRLRPAESDRQSAQTTREALSELIDNLESYFRILRSKKEASLNLVDFVKVKVMSRLQDNYLQNCFPEEECKIDLERLKKGMIQAYDYAQGLYQLGI